MPLSVAIVTETYPPEVNGVAMTIGQLVRGMRERGHQVGVIRPRQQGEAASLHSDDLLLPGLPLPGYQGLRFGLPAGRHLQRHWRRQRPDIVHVVTEGPLGWSAVAAARRLGIPVTSGFHTNFDRYAMHYGLGWLRPLVTAYLRTLHRRTVATLVPTEALAAELAGEGVPGVRLVGRGIDSTLFNPVHRSASLRAEWGLAPEQLACLYVGRLAPEKNLDLACRAFDAIQSQRPEARMIWVGDGPSARHLAQSRPSDHFAGTRRGHALAEHYASADVFIFPSLSETYGNVVAEAMASGLAVLAYRSAAAAELISSGENGLSVLPGDEAGYLGAAITLACQPGLVPRLGEKAHIGMQHRSWSQVVGSFEAVLLDLAGSRPALSTDNRN